MLGESSTLQVADGTSIGNSTDQASDGELRVNFNRYFGEADRLFGRSARRPALLRHSASALARPLPCCYNFA